MIAIDRRQGVRTLLPRILLKFSITVILVLCAGSYYLYTQVNSHMRTMQNNAIQAMTDGTVAGLSNMIITRDYILLQETLRQSMDNRNIDNLVVTDTKGKILSEMVRKNDVAEPVFTDEVLEVPTANTQSTLVIKGHDRTTIWQKIDSRYLVGWLRIQINSSQYDHIVDNLTYNLIGIIVIMILFMGLLVSYQFHVAYGQFNQYETGLLDAVHTDPLTKLPNRLVLDSALLKSMQGAVVNNSSFAVAFVDLDGFKQINDTLGHDQGDSLLIEVAARFKKMLRDNDTIIRMGGDEFVLILNDIVHKDLNKLLGRIVNRINEPYYLNGIKADIGISIGVTEYQVAHSTLTSLIKQADKAMYHAKRSGKNRVVFFKDIENEAH